MLVVLDLERELSAVAFSRAVADGCSLTVWASTVDLHFCFSSRQNIEYHRGRRRLCEVCRERTALRDVLEHLWYFL